MSEGRVRLRGRGAPHLLALAMLAAAAGALLLPATAAAAATAPTFGTPTATSTFGKGLDFSQPVNGLTGSETVGIEIEYPKALGPALTIVKPSGGTLTYHLDTSQGQLVPNTKIVARWVVTLADKTVVTGPDVTVMYLDDRFKWQTKQSKLITIHWYQGDDAFATRALAIGEQGIEKAANLLGARNVQPVDFFVYADQQAFYDALGPGTRENVGGEAHSEIRTLFALITPDQLNASWVGIVVPHELTHVVVDDVLGDSYSRLPTWLNEGIAVDVSQGYDASDRALVSGAAKSGDIMPLNALTGMFPTGDHFYLAYAEAVSAVDYLVRTHGQDALVKLVQTYATSVTDDEAFKTALGVTIDDFGAGWLKDNGVSSVTKYGPQPAPTGKLPQGWTSGSGATGAPASQAAATQAAASGAPTSQSSRGPTAAVQSDNTPLIFAIALVCIAAGLLVAAFVLYRRSNNGPDSGGWL